VKPERLHWAEHVAGRTKIIKALRILVRKPLAKRPIRRWM
jgi:hypothetical protein